MATGGYPTGIPHHVASGNPRPGVGTDWKPGLFGRRDPAGSGPGPKAAPVPRLAELRWTWKSPTPRRKTCTWERKRAKEGKNKGPHHL